MITNISEHVLLEARHLKAQLEQANSALRDLEQENERLNMEKLSLENQRKALQEADGKIHKNFVMS